jgi:ABC-type antimicrobial peptide transport system permease subunit
MARRIAPVTAVANTHATIGRSGPPAGTARGADRPSGPAGCPPRTGQCGRFLDDATEKLPTVVLSAKAASLLGFTTLPPNSDNLLLPFGGCSLGLAGMALLVGATGVANTMVIIVLERRREIRLRRALGANHGHIRVQFLTESVALSMVVAATMGTTLDAATTIAYATYQGWPAVVPPAVIGAVIAGSVVVGILAGGYPAMRAARLSPTEALSTS